MKAILVLVCFLVSSAAFAHCPIPIKTDKGNFCTDQEWNTGERMVKGALQGTDILSPFLNRNGDIPQKWIYSRVTFRIWVDGDKTHAPAVIAGLRIFPYMQMVDGMHHVGAYKFEFSTPDAGYVLSGFSLQEMPGCWSLRWTVEANDTLDSSSLGLNITGYSNLSEDENLVAAKFCDATGTTAPIPGEHHHH